MLYRNLTDTEISVLAQHGCHAENWNLVKVKEGFDAQFVRHTSFSGTNQLGVFLRGSGIMYANLINCTVEDNATVAHVGLLENYIVRSHATVTGCGNIKADGQSSFGNGTKVSCVNEGGGRDVTLFNGITAQTAYIMAFMRHRPLMIERLEKLINAEVAFAKSEKGIIGHHAKIVSCTTLTNVTVGDHATIEGAAHLNNGTVLSSLQAPTYVGHGVTAYDFIAGFGSKIDNGSMLKKCFVGEGSVIDRQFSADNSLVFSNCQLYNGEACSIFAAPYTVSHHKSTLLIAAHCSFMNVGSGSNQSNHMYKLGPLHQGIMERGCKLGSDSYILWPGKIGPFTFVTGRHYSNPDLADFPYSYLLDDNGTSQLVPGANFRSVGTLRDAIKWPDRDARKSVKSDLLHFDLLNPYCAMLAYNGKNRLRKLEDSAQADTATFNVGDVKVKKPALKRGIEIYDEVLTLFVGNVVVKKIIEGDTSFSDKNNLDSSLDFEWHDLAGLFVNRRHLNELLDQIECGDITSMSKVTKTMSHWHAQYPNYAEQWAMDYSNELVGVQIAGAAKEELLVFIDKWAQASTRFYQMLAKDAQKEFSERSKTGYGASNEQTVRQRDFEAVRGTYDTNGFVKQIMEKTVEIKAMAAKSKEMLNQQP